MADHSKDKHQHPQYDERFNQVVNFLIDKEEGGYQNSANDSGNIGDGHTPGNVGTKYGISAASYPGLDIVHLTREKAVEIYHDDFWKASGADKLPAPADQVYMDTVVNGGHPAQNLQMALNDQGIHVPVTGKLDEATIAAAHEADPNKLAESMMLHQEEYYRSLGGPNLPGWENRLDKLGDGVGVDFEKSKAVSFGEHSLEQAFKGDQKHELTDIRQSYEIKAETAAVEEQLAVERGEDPRKAHSAFQDTLLDSQRTAQEQIHDIREIDQTDKSLKHDFKQHHGLDDVAQEYDAAMKAAKETKAQHLAAGEDPDQVHAGYVHAAHLAQNHAQQEVKDEKQFETRDAELKHEMRSLAFKDIREEYVEDVKAAKESAEMMREMGGDPAEIRKDLKESLSAAQDKAAESIHERKAQLHASSAFVKHPGHHEPAEKQGASMAH
jgi:lysozyme family protein